MPEGRGSVPERRSDRSLARSTWNSPTPKEPSRRARYDRAQTQSQRYFASKGASCFLRKANHSNHRIGAHTARSDRTLRDGSFEAALSRHFVPGLRSDRPSGTGGKAPSEQQIVSTIP
jgi:hypothetical protein